MTGAGDGFEMVTATMSRVAWDMFRDYVETYAESLNAPTVYFRPEIAGRTLQLDGLVMGVALDDSGGVVFDVSLENDQDLELPSTAIALVEWP